MGIVRCVHGQHVFRFLMCCRQSLLFFHMHGNLNPRLEICLSQGVKKIPVVPVPDRPYFFLPTLLFFQRDWPCDPIFSRWLRAAHTACQNGVCCHTNYWTKLPKFVQRKYATLVNIDVGTLLQIAKQKKRQNHEKKIISDLPTLMFSRYFFIFIFI
jgi:hypothetical protein